MVDVISFLCIETKSINSLSVLQHSLILESSCPWIVPNSYDWIYITPAIIVLFVNSIFLFRIMWVSYICTHSSTRIPSQSNEAHISIIKNAASNDVVH